MSSRSRGGSSERTRNTTKPTRSKALTPQGSTGTFLHQHLAAAADIEETDAHELLFDDGELPLAVDEAHGASTKPPAAKPATVKASPRGRKRRSDELGLTTPMVSLPGPFTVPMHTQKGRSVTPLILRRKSFEAAACDSEEVLEPTRAPKRHRSYHPPHEERSRGAWSSEAGSKLSVASSRRAAERVQAAQEGVREYIAPLRKSPKSTSKGRAVSTSSGKAPSRQDPMARLLSACHAHDQQARELPRSVRVHICREQGVHNCPATTLQNEFHRETPEAIGRMGKSHEHCCYAVLQDVTRAQAQGIGEPMTASLLFSLSHLMPNAL
jgi:hypothetical protein